MKKQYVVFGAGRFGKSIAVTLQEQGCEVLVVDKDPAVIDDIADSVSYAICANAENAETFAELGMRNLDGAIVACAGSLEASIVTTMMCHEIGIPHILCKAKNKTHEKILKKVGATKVIYPEVEMGKRVAKFLCADNFADWIELSPKYSLVEMDIPSVWQGRSLAQLKLREEYHLNVVGIKQEGDLQVNLNPHDPLPKNSVLIVVGDNEDLEQFQK